MSSEQRHAEALGTIIGIQIDKAKAALGAAVIDTMPPQDLATTLTQVLVGEMRNDYEFENFWMKRSGEALGVESLAAMIRPLLSPLLTHESLIERQAQQIDQLKKQVQILGSACQLGALDMIEVLKRGGEQIEVARVVVAQRKAQIDAADALVAALEKLDSRFKCHYHEITGFCYRCEVGMVVETYTDATKGLA